MRISGGSRTHGRSGQPAPSKFTTRSTGPAKCQPRTAGSCDVHPCVATAHVPGRIAPHIKWFGEEIVRTGIQAIDFVGCRTTCRQKHHGEPVLVGPQLPQYLQSCTPGSPGRGSVSRRGGTQGRSYRVAATQPVDRILFKPERGFQGFPSWASSSTNSIRTQFKAPLTAPPSLYPRSAGGNLGGGGQKTAIFPK